MSVSETKRYGEDPYEVFAILFDEEDHSDGQLPIRDVVDDYIGDRESAVLYTAKLAVRDQFGNWVAVDPAVAFRGVPDGIQGRGDLDAEETILGELIEKWEGLQVESLRS